MARILRCVPSRPDEWTLECCLRLPAVRKAPLASALFRCIYTYALANRIPLSISQCWIHPARNRSVQHISLPQNVVCDAPANWLMRQQVDMCSAPTGPERGNWTGHRRWFFNLTATLLAAPKCRAIVVTRDKIFTRISKKRNHCRHASNASSQPDVDATILEEEMVGREILRQALERVPERVLTVAYDELEWLREHVWARIGQHVGFSMEGRPAPIFHSGNARWLKPHYADDLKAFATDISNLNGASEADALAEARRRADSRYIEVVTAGEADGDEEVLRVIAYTTSTLLLLALAGWLCVLLRDHSRRKQLRAVRGGQLQEVARTVLVGSKRNATGQLGVSLRAADGVVGGVLFAAVVQDDVAWVAGLRQGDVVLSADGVTTEEPLALIEAADSAHCRGATLHLQVVDGLGYAHALKS